MITTADSSGNLIGVSDEQLNISVSMSVQLGLDVRQQQNAEGERSLLENEQLYGRSTVQAHERGMKGHRGLSRYQTSPISTI